MNHVNGVMENSLGGLNGGQHKNLYMNVVFWITIIQVSQTGYLENALIDIVLFVLVSIFTYYSFIV